ncbi:ImmA/IrrE family metallo-endopeptidase [Ectobacillus panaciterrae]|uniref:ImmA/IrrE family metallo-endopeptidase n=1 Tax=Ectobacillus panaciterrae TaxID=363872 RepID=UPI00042A8056|nr:hypothetical protein [Ectobacillus panaciterrae]
MAPCLVLDVYIAPGSDMTQQMFQNHMDWIDFVYGVPGTFWGGQSPNSCRFDIRWRFRDPNDSQKPVMANIAGPVVNRGGIQCGPTFDQYNDNLKFWLSQRPTGPGPWGVTDKTDIAVYYIQGPFAGGADGCAPFYTPSGQAIVISNADPGFTRGGMTLAHELGHVLLSYAIQPPDNQHSDDPNNLMFRTTVNTAFHLTPEQCNIMRNSPVFKDCQ